MTEDELTERQIARVRTLLGDTAEVPTEQIVELLREHYPSVVRYK